MKEQTMGAMIATLRKEKGMTQLDLAQQLGVTDKAVSKWERELSCPDVNTIPRLAEVLGVSVEELMRTERKQDEEKGNELQHVLDICLKAIPLAMGIALIVTSILKKDLDVYTIAGLAGIGLLCLSVHSIRQSQK